MVVAAGPPAEAVVPQRIRTRRHLVVPLDANGVVRVRVLALDVGAGAPVAQEVAAHVDGEVVVPPPLAVGVARATAAAPAAAPAAAAAPVPAPAPAAAAARGAGAGRGARGGGGGG